MNIDIIIYILLFVTALRYPALVIMYAVVILINTLTSTYLQNLDLVNINSTGALFINLFIVYKLYKYCLSKVVTTTKTIEKSEGLMSIFNIFKERTCEDGILCSFIVFVFYLSIFLIITGFNYAGKYGITSAQGMLVYISMAFIFLMIYLFYNYYSAIKHM